ncbi:MAG: hypothetical protein GY946_33410 [bacterium]|nr:hypothetical protein [bacterium]
MESDRNERVTRGQPWRRRSGFVFGGAGLFGATLLATAWSNIGAAPEGERLERILQSSQYDTGSGRFVNTLPARNEFGVRTLWDGIMGRPNTTPEQPPPLFDSTTRVLASVPADDLRVTWFGHSSLLIEIDGARVLTDPVWGSRASPWSFMGPKRFHAPPLALEELPELDAVVISHDHYDHLDAPTIRRLAESVPLFLVPLGVGARLESWGVETDRIVELDWWDEHEVAGVSIAATPARHFSGRSIIDSNKTLWAGWALVGPRHRAYFSGDTAMFPGFEEIGSRLGPFDIAMIESGAYNKGWADAHLGPEQALQAFQDVRGKVFMPVHWGTFDLALHAWTEPAERILAGADAAGIPVAVPQPGESIEPSDLREVVRWWPDLPWDSADEHPVVSSGLDRSENSPPRLGVAVAEAAE